MSKYLDKTDKKTVTLFADGAGAVILSAQQNTKQGFIASEIKSEGQYHDWMGIYAGGSHQPISQKVFDQKVLHSYQFHPNRSRG